MHWSKLSLKSILFTHIDPNTKVNTVFCVTSLAEDPRVQALEERNVVISEQGGQAVIAARGLEKHRMIKLADDPWTEGENRNPVLFCEMPDGTHLLVDGNHRYAMAYIVGHRVIKGVSIPEPIWRDHVVTGFPDTTEDELAKSFSGML